MLQLAVSHVLTSNLYSDCRHNDTGIMDTASGMQLALVIVQHRQRVLCCNQEVISHTTMLVVVYHLQPTRHSSHGLRNMQRVQLRQR
jgi:hypothetical protein